MQRIDTVIPRGRLAGAMAGGGARRLASCGARRFAGWTLAVAVALAALAGCGEAAAPSAAPTVTPTSSAGPSASVVPSSVPPGSSESPATLACANGDIRASGGPWGGAAGSRGVDVTVQNTGASACRLPARPAVAALDAGGNIVLRTAPAAEGIGPTIGAGGTAAFSLLFGNWCAQSPRLPFHFSLALDTGSVDIAGVVANSPSDLPPCNGPEQPAVLSATDWATS